jgi:aspartyl aminopeptidase
MFVAIEAASKMLLASGYTQIRERDEADWKGLQPGGKYFFHRNQVIHTNFTLIIVLHNNLTLT